MIKKEMKRREERKHNLAINTVIDSISVVDIT